MLSSFDSYLRDLRYRRPTRITLAPAGFLAILLMICCCTLSFASPIQEEDEDGIPERPSTELLLPETTVAFVQIDNFRDLVEKLRESAGGQLWNDESITPLIDGMWEEAQNSYDDVKDEVGLELEDLTSLPAGELTFAVIAPRRKNPEFMLIMELNDENEVLDRVLNRGRELVEEESGESIATETSEDGFEIESFNVDGESVKFFRHKDLVVGCTSEDELNAFIDRWMGREVEKVRPLTANRKFVTIMNRCVGTDELKPEARFFVDPISLAKSATRGDIASQAAINFLPLIGLDGLLGIGGSMLLSEEEFDSVVHGHVLLANPRGGVFEMISLKPTYYEPESWLPSDVTNYWTTSWDFDKMLSELTTIIEAFQGEGVVDEFIEERINAELQLDFKEDIIGQMAGRVTYTQWMEPPATINSGVNMIAIELRDPEKAREVIQAILDRINQDLDPDEEPRLVETEYRGISIWCESDKRLENRRNQIQEFRDRRRREREERTGEAREERIELSVQQPRPAFAIVGNSLIISPQSRDFMEHAIDTELGSAPALRDDEDYLAIEKRMRKLLKNEMPCALFFQNPEETIKSLMDVAKAENTNQFLNQAAEGNEYLQRFKSRLDENPLPEFDRLKKYFTKSGGFATTDDTGYHFLFFNLKPENEVDE
ncbi:MAG: DUF3352 domain-containing protein [Planctomycetota bacterium]